MKRNVLLIVLAVLLASAPMAMAYEVRFVNDSYGPYQTGLGGEFTVLPDFNVQPYYVSTKTGDISAIGTFQTFCLEQHETVYANQIYTAVFNNAAVEGGIQGSSDPISKGTAWLYAQFAATTLTGYNYATGGTSADLLQQAIWYLEGEQATIGANSFLALAIARFGASVTDDYTGSAVQVLNLYDKDGNRAQDILVVVATPVPAAVWLLGTGLVGLVGIRRKFKK